MNMTSFAKDRKVADINVFLNHKVEGISGLGVRRRNGLGQLKMDRCSVWNHEPRVVAERLLGEQPKGQQPEAYERVSGNSPMRPDSNGRPSFREALLLIRDGYFKGKVLPSGGQAVVQVSARTRLQGDRLLHRRGDDHDAGFVSENRSLIKAPCLLRICSIVLTSARSQP